MFKPALITPEQFKTAPVKTDESTANYVFKVLHGAYGNLFLSKFASGVTDEKGRDMGVGSARKVWAHTLRDIPESVVGTALDRCQAENPEYPPTLPQFVAFCKACAPRQVYQFALPAPSIDRTAQAKKARELLANIKASQGMPSGITLLKQAIADAVACAGGDEGAALARLDRMFQPKQGIAA